jgi:hypothetical protein
LIGLVPVENLSAIGAINVSKPHKYIVGTPEIKDSENTHERRLSENKTVDPQVVIASRNHNK